MGTSMVVYMYLVPVRRYGMVVYMYPGMANLHGYHRGRSTCMHS